MSSSVSGCARRPEIVGVRRPEVVPVSSTSPPVDIEIAPAPDDAPGAEAADAACECSLACLSKRLCNGWTGLLFGLSASAGMLAIIYLLASILPLNAGCDSPLACGALYPDTYTCHAPKCLSGTYYTLEELQGIAAGDVEFSLVSQPIGQKMADVMVYDHHAFECTEADGTDGIFTAARAASLACLQTRIDPSATSASYLAAADAVMRRGRGVCVVDDSSTDYCSPSPGCSCETFPESGSAASSTSGESRMLVDSGTGNHSSNATCSRSNSAAAPPRIGPNFTVVLSSTNYTCGPS